MVKNMAVVIMMTVILSGCVLRVPGIPDHYGPDRTPPVPEIAEGNN
jgi:hypothetical protein